MYACARTHTHMLVLGIEHARQVLWATSFTQAIYFKQVNILDFEYILHMPVCFTHSILPFLSFKNCFIQQIFIGCLLCVR